MKDKIISQGFIRTFGGTWVNLNEVIELAILESDKKKPYIVALGDKNFDYARLSSDFNSKDEAQAWLDYVMLQ